MLCVPQLFFYLRGERISLKLMTRADAVGEVLESIKTGDLIICYLCRDVYFSSKIRFNVSVVAWQCKNETSIHKTAKHFSINSKHMVGRNHKRKCHPPPVLCTKATKVAKTGAVLAGHYSIVQP